MNESYKKWLDEGKPKVFCQCECNQEINIKRHHRIYGIPKYINGHNPPHNKGKHLSEITKYKISIAWEYNKDKHCKNISIAMKGKISPQKGKKRMDICGENNPSKRIEVRQKISNYHKGKILSQETIEKLSGENGSNWQGGISFLPYCSKFNKQKKEEIREQYNRKCYVCGKDEKDNVTKYGENKKLFVHHVDMDKEQGCNDKKWKLVPLCMQCHANLHHGKNKKDLNKIIINKLGCE